MKKKTILLDNGYVAWKNAIEDAKNILEGRATLKYRKQFVSSLHNAVEIFLKQIMINQNDHRVIKISKVNKDGSPAKEYYAAENLNEYLNQLEDEERKKLFSIDFKDLISFSKDILKEYREQYHPEDTWITDIRSDLKLLQELRNNEIHFYVDAYDFLSEDEFLKLYNFMIDFLDVIVFYGLMPWKFGKPFTYGEDRYLWIDGDKMQSFSYKEALLSSNFYKKIKEIIECGGSYPSCGESVYFIAKNIFEFNKESLSENDFEDLWVYIDMLLKYRILKIEEFIDYDEDEDGNPQYYGWDEYKLLD